MTNKKTSDIIKSSKGKREKNEINYEVRTAEGANFFTVSYTDAIRKGNRILKTFFVNIDEKSDKEKEWLKNRAEKIKNKFQRA